MEQQRENRYKIAIFDLDGTLTNSRKELTPRTREALIALQRRGVKVVLASGRPTYGIIPLANELKLSSFGGYILAYNGGVIIDCKTMQEIYSSKIEERFIEELYKESKLCKCTILSYRDAVILAEEVNGEYVQYEAMLNKMETCRVDSFVESFRCDVPKCLAVGEPERAVGLVERLNERFSEQMNVYRSEPFFVEIVPLGVDKALSLGRLALHLGIESEDMISFGDGFNDLSMIEYAGCGVAMANAQEAVKESADVVTLSNEEDGVAVYVERELLSESC
ncbi:MAG: Cof-type HAD-IIB family hydrolase [Rikenellaceae bacterium]